MAKHKTNTQKLTYLAKTADPVHVALAVTYLLDKADNILANENEVREAYKDSMIHPNLIITNAKVIKEMLTD